MATLDGSGREVNLGLGITVRAPGLRGSAQAHNVAPGSDTRAPEVDGSSPALDEALTNEGFLRLRVITLDVAPVPNAPSGDIRSPVSDLDGMEVNVPDLGDDVAQVLLAVDENGVVSWNFPVDGGGELAPTNRGSGPSVRFIVPAFASTPDPGEGDATRGIFGLVGRKVLELVALPLAGLGGHPPGGCRRTAVGGEVADRPRASVRPRQLLQPRRAQPGRRRLEAVGLRTQPVVRARHLREHSGRLSRISAGRAGRAQ